MKMSAQRYTHTLRHTQHSFKLGVFSSPPSNLKLNCSPTSLAGVIELFASARRYARALRCTQHSFKLEVSPPSN